MVGILYGRWGGRVAVRRGANMAASALRPPPLPAQHGRWPAGIMPTCPYYKRDLVYSAVGGLAQRMYHGYQTGCNACGEKHVAEPQNTNRGRGAAQRKAWGLHRKARAARWPQPCLEAHPRHSFPAPAAEPFQGCAAQPSQHRRMAWCWGMTNTVCTAGMHMQYTPFCGAIPSGGGGATPCVGERGEGNGGPTSTLL